MDPTTSDDVVVWSSDSDSDDEYTPAPKTGAGEAGPSRPSLVREFVAMGFREEVVERVVLEKGEGNAEDILETLLQYQDVEKSQSKHDEPPIQSTSPSHSWDDDLSDFGDYEEPGVAEDLSAEEFKLLNLANMGFPVDAASSAIARCGHEASFVELVDSIHAAGLAEEEDERFETSMPSSSESCVTVFPPKKRRKSEDMSDNRRNFSIMKEETGKCLLPKPMIGFGLPNERQRIAHRKLPDVAIGPPYFYFENVALTPKGVWDTISHCLYDIDPEFVDSQYFCCASRKRGYIHNLPIQNRVPLQPIPHKTIHTALPYTKKWWPTWDCRTHLNCIQTSIASATLLGKLSKAANIGSDRARKYVLKECRRWNLVWVGLNKVAPLEPDEIEMILGFPKNHTRGVCKTDRYKSLGNSFQIDTVAFHLSVLKDMFPDGIKVLSLFSGIGGAEVALHRLGIRLKVVVSAEISVINQKILRGWWEDTNQTGELIELGDVQNLVDDVLRKWIHRFNGFDLIIGGSPCNNLSGNNRVSRHGLEGKESSLFYDYQKILRLVKSIMEERR